MSSMTCYALTSTWMSTTAPIPLLHRGGPLPTRIRDAVEHRLYEPVLRFAGWWGEIARALAERQHPPVPGLRDGRRHRSAGGREVRLIAALSQVVVAFVGAPLLVGVMRPRASPTGRARRPAPHPALAGHPQAGGKERIISSTPAGFSRSRPSSCGHSALVAGIVPFMTTRSALDQVGDLFAVVYLLLLGTVFLALAGVDPGTAFGGMGSSRAMTVAAVAEPSILLAIFALSVNAGSSNLGAIVTSTLSHPRTVASPESLLAFGALGIVALAETGRLPVDNPSTHLELTMIHEAMILEYAGADLALVELAAHMRLVIFLGLLANLFAPWGIATTTRPLELVLGRCCGRRQDCRAWHRSRGVRGVRREAAPVPRSRTAGRFVRPRIPGRYRVVLPGMNDTLFVQLLDLAVGLVLLCAFVVLWRRGLVAIVRALTVQGVALAAVALVLGVHEHDVEPIVVAALVLFLKGAVLPGVLLRIVRASDETREVEPLVNVPASLLAAAGLTLLAYATTRDLVALDPTPQTRAIPIGIAVRSSDSLCSSPGARP